MNSTLRIARTALHQPSRGCGDVLNVTCSKNIVTGKESSGAKRCNSIDARQRGQPIDGPPVLSRGGKRKTDRGEVGNCCRYFFREIDKTRSALRAKLKLVHSARESAPGEWRRHGDSVRRVGGNDECWSSRSAQHDIRGVRWDIRILNGEKIPRRGAHVRCRHGKVPRARRLRQPMRFDIAGDSAIGAGIVLAL